MAERKDVKVEKNWEDMTIAIKGYGIERTYDLNELPDTMKDRCMVLGASNKLRDSYAGKTEEWYKHTDAVWDALKNNEWERKATSKLTKLQELADAGAFNAKQMKLLKGLGLIK